jgi:hypothetical protein
VRLAIAATLALALAAGGCATTLVKQDVRRQSDGWTVTFHELTDGPNGFTTRDGTQHLPKSGMRFLWVILSIRNDTAAARQFSFDSCGLDMGDSVSLPLYVGMNLGTSAAMNETPELSAGEEVTRKLAFGYPDKRFPDRLVCFGNEIDVRRR